MPSQAICVAVNAGSSDPVTAMCASPVLTISTGFEWSSQTTSTYARGFAFSNARASASIVVCSGPLPTMTRLPAISARLEGIKIAVVAAHSAHRRNQYGKTPDRCRESCAVGENVSAFMREIQLPVLSGVLVGDSEPEKTSSIDGGAVRAPNRGGSFEKLAARLLSMS